MSSSATTATHVILLYVLRGRHSKIDTQRLARYLEVLRVICSPPAPSPHDWCDGYSNFIHQRSLIASWVYFWHGAHLVLLKERKTDIRVTACLKRANSRT
ncbi:unnamed protein product [Nesidiocoris tenuis]|uniref:Uncharacterized protein n=1 Tax=Nesidiocoris tenuis TaxID=355587 RepID=A0A6H5H257_9HEMI|nr:unnamed protein product [Nesidiocoris tenuis]